MARRRAMDAGENRRPDDPKLHRYVIDGVWEVLAGRTDADNDRLSLKVARANDWWFHVSGQPGSHVILRVPDGEEPTREVLKQAAGCDQSYCFSEIGGALGAEHIVTAELSGLGGQLIVDYSQRIGDESQRRNAAM